MSSDELGRMVRRLSYTEAISRICITSHRIATWLRWCTIETTRCRPPKYARIWFNFCCRTLGPRRGGERRKKKKACTGWKKKKKKNGRWNKRAAHFDLVNVITAYRHMRVCCIMYMAKMCKPMNGWARGLQTFDHNARHNYILDSCSAHIRVHIRREICCYQFKLGISCSCSTCAKVCLQLRYIYIIHIQRACHINIECV